MFLSRNAKFTIPLVRVYFLNKSGTTMRVPVPAFTKVQNGFKRFFLYSFCISENLTNLKSQAGVGVHWHPLIAHKKKFGLGSS